MVIPAAPGTIAAISIEELSYANLRKERQVWSLAKAEAGKAKRWGSAERIEKATIALAIAKRAVRAAATAAEAATAAATAAPTYSLEEVEAIEVAAAAAAAAAVVTAEREAAKVAAREAEIVAAREAARAAREVAAARAVRKVAAARAVREAAKKEKKEGGEAEKIISAIASEYRKIQAVLERVEEKKRPLAASTMREHKRQKKESDRIRDITPKWIENDPVLHELHQQLRADDLEREQEQLVAKTKNEKNKSEKMVASEMKKWLDSGGVTDLASINKKRRELEEQARIQRIDDRFESDYLNYAKKMNKFHNQTIPIMQHYKWVEAPAAAAANPSSSPMDVTGMQQNSTVSIVTMMQQEQQQQPMLTTASIVSTNTNTAPLSAPHLASMITRTGKSARDNDIRPAVAEDMISSSSCPMASPTPPSDMVAVSRTSSKDMVADIADTKIGTDMDPVSSSLGTTKFASRTPSSDMVADIGTKMDTDPSSFDTTKHASRTASDVVLNIGTDPSPAATDTIVASRTSSSDMNADPPTMASSSRTTRNDPAIVAGIIPTATTTINPISRIPTADPTGDLAVAFPREMDIAHSTDIVPTMYPTGDIPRTTTRMDPPDTDTNTGLLSVLGTTSGITDPEGDIASPSLVGMDHQILCGIFHGVCKELKAIQEAFYVSPQLGKYLHDIMPRDSRTIAVKIKGVFFRKIIKLCNSYLDFLNMIGEAITGGLGTRGNKKRIMKVLAYQVNREKLFPLMTILDLICTEAHVNHSLYCHVNGALQKELLIERVPKFIDCKSLFLIDGDLLSTLTKVEFDFEVIAHELIWKRHLYNIQAFKENCCPLPADTAKLNLNIANATMQHVHYKEKDGSYTKSPKKVLVFGIPWCIIVFCTGASGMSFCWNGDLVLHKFNDTLFVDGLGHVFERGLFDSKVEFREVTKQVDGDGYSLVPVHFSSQFIPYIYRSNMRVATLQWAGILGSWYLLDETCDHLTGDKTQNGILHTQPASKQENIDRRPLQGLAPLVGGRSCLQ